MLLSKYLSFKYFFLVGAVEKNIAIRYLESFTGSRCFSFHRQTRSLPCKFIKSINQNLDPSFNRIKLNPQNLISVAAKPILFIMAYVNFIERIYHGLLMAILGFIIIRNVRSFVMNLMGGIGIWLRGSKPEPEPINSGSNILKTLSENKRFVYFISNFYSLII